MSDDLEKRLRCPPFGTETSERKLMAAAADEIARFRAECDALLEKNHKFLWQVRDTCTRAERAEAQRDALRVEVVNLRDDLASAERERAHQYDRSERRAVGYAQERGKREALQARVAELEGLIRAVHRNAKNLAGAHMEVTVKFIDAPDGTEGKKDEV